jgi:large subunit ribosomal protein L29
MTGEDVRKMTSEEIGVEIKRLSERLFTLRSQAVTEKVEDLSQFGKLKKDIARLKTEESARRIKAAGGNGAVAAAAPKAPRMPAKKPSAARAARPASKKPVTHARKAPAGPKNPRKAGASARTSKNTKAKSAK